METGTLNERVAPVVPPYDAVMEKAFAGAVPPPLPPLRLYAQVARNPTLFGRLVEGGILGHRGLLWLDQMAANLRELIILRTTARMRAGYEWSVHVAYFGKSSGLSAEQVAATCRDAVDPSLWSKRQRLVLRLVDTCVVGDDVGDALWAELSAEFEDAEIIEAIALSGLYRTVSNLATVMRTANEPRVPVFPGWEGR